MGLVCLLLTGLSLLYLVVVVALERLLSEQTLPTYVLRHVPQPLLVMPLGLALFFAIIFWRRRLVIANVLLMVGAVALLMPPQLPAGRPKVSAGTVRVATWNVHEEVEHVDRLQTAIARQKPQVVCLQESRRASFATVLPGGKSAHTREVTTLTTGEIASEGPFSLGEFPNYRYGLATRLRLPQGQLTVLNVHFVTAFTGRTVRRNRSGFEAFVEQTREARRLEGEAVVKWLRDTPGPRLVVGDFNTPPNVDLYRQLCAAAEDAFDAVGLGWGYTFRRDHPMIRIDHVLCAGGVTPVRVRTVDGHASDHRMVVADVALPGAPVAIP